MGPHRVVLLGVLAGLALLAASAPASATPSVDQQYTGGTVWTPGRGYWQSVQVQDTLITKVDLFLQSPCNGAEPVRLKVTTSADPNTGVLADLDDYQYKGPVGTGAWVSFDFPDVSVAPLTVLYLHLLPTGLPGPFCFEATWWSYSNSGTYPSGQASWSGSADINFRVWGDYPEQVLSNGVTATSSVASTGDARYFRFNVPAGTTQLFFEQSGTTPDLDLYVRSGSRPTTTDWDCRPYSGTSAETCSFSNPAQGWWYAMASSYSGSGTVTMKATATTNRNPYTPSLSSPANGATGVSWSPAFSWSSSGDPDGDPTTYQAYVQPSGGSAIVACTATHPIQSCSWSGAARGTTYSWWVQASDGRGGTATSTTWTFTTRANSAPRLPSNPSPPDQQTGVGWSPTLGWTNNGDPDNDPTTIAVYADTSSNPTALQYGPAAGLSSCAMADLSRGTTYFWKVVTTDSYGAQSSATWRFTTKPNQAPTAGFTVSVSGLTATFDASPPNSGDPDGDPLTYIWSFGDGGQAWGATATHAYSCLKDDGTPYVVDLGVVDGHGGSAETVKLVTVSDVDQDPRVDGGTGDGLVACRESRQGTSDHDVDSDDDGIDDFAESAFNPDRVAVFCPPWPHVEADCAYPHPTQRDLYVELDWQDGFAPSAAMLAIVQDRFDNSPLPDDIHLVVDAGQLGGGSAALGGAGKLSWTDVGNAHRDHMDARRQDVYRYGAIACHGVNKDGSDSDGYGGLGDAPGRQFVVYTETAHSCAVREPDAGVAHLLMHELGHNLLGQRKSLSGGPFPASCDTDGIRRRVNDALNEDFAKVDDPPRDDCDGDAHQDLFSHSIQAIDAMGSGGTYYRGTTWDAMRLNMGIGPLAPSCGHDSTGQPTADDALQAARDALGDPVLPSVLAQDCQAQPHPSHADGAQPARPQGGPFAWSAVPRWAPEAWRSSKP
jgi:hypothetical protein